MRLVVLYLIASRMAFASSCAELYLMLMQDEGQNFGLTHDESEAILSSQHGTAFVSAIKLARFARDSGLHRTSAIESLVFSIKRGSGDLSRAEAAQLVHAALEDNLAPRPEDISNLMVDALVELVSKQGRQVLESDIREAWTRAASHRVSAIRSQMRAADALSHAVRPSVRRSQELAILLPAFNRSFKAFKESSQKRIIEERIARVDKMGEDGLGDHNSIRSYNQEVVIDEMRLFINGAHLRIYYKRNARGQFVILLVGKKEDQKHDIPKARRAWEDYKAASGAA